MAMAQIKHARHERRESAEKRGLVLVTGVTRDARKTGRVRGSGGSLAHSTQAQAEVKVTLNALSENERARVRSCEYRESAQKFMGMEFWD